MDKTLKHQEIICQVLSKYQDFFAGATGLNNQKIDPETIFDRQNNHFQLLLKGWSGYRHIFKIAFHLDIINEKIWLQQNNTELDIVDELMAKGVPKTDIVLGFIAPAERQYTDFAVA
jgi:hypothetical protein